MNKKLVTPEALKLMALRSADGSVVGEAGGWSLVLSRPDFDNIPPWAVKAPHKLGAKDTKSVNLGKWWLSAGRINHQAPTPGNLAFLRKFVVALGGPNKPGEAPVVGSLYWMWHPKEAD